MPVVGRNGAALMSSLRRMLAILDLFGPDRPVWKADEVAAKFGCSVATAYRYLAELCRAGLLSRVNGDYTLGARIIELDYTIRACDPLRQAALPAMQELRDRTGCDVLLADMIGDRILASHHERGNDPATIGFGRGRPMPLFRGAGSKAILAALPPARLRRLFAAHRDEIAAAGLGEDWDAFRRAAAAIRRAGHAISLGELEPQNVAVGAPIQHGDGASPGSLVLVLSRERWGIVDKQLIVTMVCTAAARIAAAATDTDGTLGSIASAPRAGKRRQSN